MQCSTKVLFDDLVGARGKRRRHFEAERFSGREVNHKLELGGLIHRQVRRLFTLENTADIETNPAIRVRNVIAIAHQPAIGDKFAIEVQGGNSVAPGQRDDLLFATAEERIAAHKKCISVSLP